MKKTIVILHGWKLDGKKYKELQHIFEKNGYHVLAPDLPGFGTVPLLKEAMSIDDYTEYVKSYLDKNKIKRLFLIGHSFGGRVAAKFVVKYPSYVEKLILTGSPLIRTKLSFRKKIVSSFAKRGKKIAQHFPQALYHRLRWVVYRMLGEWDYYKADALKKTFVKVAEEDLSPYLPKISSKTLVLWGEKDTFISQHIGKTIAKSIPHAQFIVLPRKGHGIPYTDARQFAKYSLAFFHS